MRPVYDAKGTAYLSVRESDGDRRPAAAVIRSLWANAITPRGCAGSTVTAATIGMSQHDLEDSEAFLAAQVAPGRWARELWEVLGPQTGLLARKALEYDPYRERPEKRLAKYLAFHVRRNVQWHAEELPLRVATLLDAIGDAIPAEPARPGRTKDRFDKALDRLAADQVIGKWVYFEAPELPARGWFDQWLSWRVVINPAENVMAHYSAMKLPKSRTSLPAPLPASDRDAILVEPGRYLGWS